MLYAFSKSLKVKIKPYVLQENFSTPAHTDPFTFFI